MAEASAEKVSPFVCVPDGVARGDSLTGVSHPARTHHQDEKNLRNQRQQQQIAGTTTDLQQTLSPTVHATTVATGGGSWVCHVNGSWA